MSSISKDGKCVQLWDLLSDVPDFVQGDIDARRKAGNEVKELLNKTARWGGQEFRLEVRDDAWVIEVFSCYDEVEPVLLRLTIPQDRKNPVRLEVFCY